ncbi:MAG TPA: DUF2269 family protein [Acidimicrobiales bacterium]
MLAEFGSGAYKLSLVLHLLTAIVGFGALVAMGVFGARAAAHGEREGPVIFDYVVSSRWAEWVIYAVPVFGIITLLLSDDAWKFSQTWISISLLLYIAIIGVYHGAHRPNLVRMNQLMRELPAGAAGAAAGGDAPPQVAELEARGQKAGVFGGILNLLLVAVVALMVWKPGV